VTQPADTVTKFFRITLASTGAVVAGLSVTEGVAFASLAFKREAGAAAVSYALGSTYTDLTGGYYSWTYSVPAAPANWAADVRAVSATHLLEICTITGETESQDLASIAALVAQPVGGAGASFAFGSPVTLELVAYRYKEATQAFTGVDLSTAAYNNWKMGIRTDDQTSTIWDCDSGALDNFSITGDASGNLSVTMPESMIGPVYTTWTASRTYALGDYVRPITNNGFCYQATAITTGIAAGAEPAWPTTIGNTIVDGGVTWTCRLRSIWLASLVTTVGTMVRPTTPNAYVYRCTVAGTRAVGEPTWPTTPGTTVADGTVTWQCLSNPHAALPVATASIDIKYEVTADKLSTAKTVPIIPSSTLTVKRRENGA
jgi:hypothetical protein